MENYFSKIVEVIRNYLGPASERFIVRQLDFHLKRKEKVIYESEVERIADWSAVALSMITQDKAMIQRCKKEISGLKI